MKKLMNFFMLSCRKATELIDKKMIVRLSLKERTMLEVHKSMCSVCTAYEKQSKQLDSLLKSHLQNPGEPNITIIENPELKNKIISKL